MKDLSYAEQLVVLNALPLSKPFPKSDVPECVADFLVHALYGARLSDIPSQSEPFRVVSKVAILTVSGKGSNVEPSRPEYARLVNLFRGTLELKRKLARDMSKIAQNNPSKAISAALRGSLSDCVGDVEIATPSTITIRETICKACPEYADACKVNGMPLARLKLVGAKCPRACW